MEIETARLFLRPPRLADVPALHAFLGDAEAMRWTRVDRSLRDCRRRIVAHERRRRIDGYAPWTVVAEPDRRIIGWGGLYQDPFEPGWGPEVGYFLRPDVWGRGYASELVAVCIALADRELRLPELRGFAHPHNIGSRGVLEKAGFAFVRFVPQMNRMLFRRGREAHAAA